LGNYLSAKDPANAVGFDAANKAIIARVSDAKQSDERIDFAMIGVIMVRNNALPF
jgi:hypothetical protein